MTRRELIKLLGISTIGCVVLPAGLLVASPGIKEHAADVIRRELHYLKLDPKGVDDFLNDYFKNDGRNINQLVRWKLYYFLGTDVKRSDNIFELVRTYLLSTDFFINRANVQREIKYIGLFNPYNNPMPNPYSYIYL